MADPIDSNFSVVRITSTPTAPVAIVKPVVTETGQTDEVVLTRAQLRQEAVVLKNEALVETTEAVRSDKQADCKAAEAVLEKREAASAEFAAVKEDKAAEQCAVEQANALGEAAQQEAQAQDTRWAAEAKQAQADQERQKAELLTTQAETLLDSNDLSQFNEGLFLLTLADSGFESADSLRGEAIHLASNVQASLDLAKASRATASQKGEQGKQHQDAAKKGHTQAAEDVELSGIAKEAAAALQLDASERRKVGERLMAESKQDLQLAELGQRVQNGFLLH